LFVYLERITGSFFQHAERSPTATKELEAFPTSGGEESWEKEDK
jgi:hypothetical protein